MAKIIFSTISGIPNPKKLPCFYEGFVNALARQGNEVMVMITNNLMKRVWIDNTTKKEIDKRDLNQKVIDFNPDLVISCNNSLYENIPQLVTCPIILYSTDSPALFLDKENLKKNTNRYDFMSASEDFIPMAKEYFGNNFKSINLLHFATDFVRQDLPQDKNISFIGTNFQFASHSFDRIFSDNFTPEKQKEFKIFIEEFRKDVLVKPEVYLEKLRLDNSYLSNISHIDLLNLLSANFRLQTLNSLCDLGLTIYGDKSWYRACYFSLDMALSYVQQEVSSVQDNQDIYNSSKIAINISHSQAGRAFSWRVRDAMACNSALVSDERGDLTTQFGKYVKIPTYTNPFEARDLCRKILADEKWRKEIVAGSQLAIEENHRFKHRIKDIEQILSIDLSPKNTQGKVIFCEYKTIPLSHSYMVARKFIKSKPLRKSGHVVKNILPKFHAVRCFIRGVRFKIKNNFRNLF